MLLDISSFIHGFNFGKYVFPFKFSLTFGNDKPKLILTTSEGFFYLIPY